MNLNKIAILAAIFIFLGGYVYIFETGPAKDDEVVTNKMEKPIDFNVEEVQEVIIKREGQIVWLKIFDGQWRIVEPVNAGVSNERVHDLLAFFDFGIVRVIEADAPDVKLYGLEPPRYEFGVKTRDNHTFKTLLIGEDAPGNLSCYARVKGGSRVVLIGVRYRQEFDRAFTEFSQTMGP